MVRVETGEDLDAGWLEARRRMYAQTLREPGKCLFCGEPVEDAKPCKTCGIVTPTVAAR